MFGIDIYRTANELIKQHDEDEPIPAAMRVDELLDAGDMDGQAVWKRILAAIEELQSKVPQAGATANCPQRTYALMRPCLNLFGSLWIALKPEAVSGIGGVSVVMSLIVPGYRF